MNLRWAAGDCHLLCAVGSVCLDWGLSGAGTGGDLDLAIIDLVDRGIVVGHDGRGERGDDD